MRDIEVRAAGDLAGEAVGGLGSLIADMHSAVAGRPFGLLGVAAAPTRFLHDRITSSVYGSLRAAGRAAPRSASAALSRLVPDQAESMSGTVRGGLALGALNGALGDRLAREGSPLALDMTLRSHGVDLEIDRTALADVFPDASGRVVVFVHGLCGTDDNWRLLPLARDGRARKSYGSRLRDELGYTPLYLRYNTGLRVSDNGRRLSDLLGRLHEEWPAEVSEIVLVGHSMGGLVARSACHYGHEQEAAWTRAVRHVVCLGTPHLGAPLEKAANLFGWALGRLPETRPFGKLVNGRSVGIKDMRFGSCVEDDWCDCDPDEFLNDRCCEVPFLDCATYYFIGATLSREPNPRFSAAAGDLLVWYPSASGNGRKRRIPFEADHGAHVGGADHLQLLNHPAVYEQLRTWLAPRELGAGTGAG
jgi:pimeloyl-ACP methyl ester carboxylesterase